MRAINDWNALPAHVVLADMLNQFKSRLDNIGKVYIILYLS